MTKRKKLVGVNIDNLNKKWIIKGNFNKENKSFNICIIARLYTPICNQTVRKEKKNENWRILFRVENGIRVGISGVRGPDFAKRGRQKVKVPEDAKDI